MQILFYVAVAFLIFCLPAYSQSSGSKAGEEGVAAALKMQSDAWNRGDLDAFMTGYLHSPDTSYASGGTEVWGYEALRARYQKKYGTSRESMGTLSFSDLKTIMLGKQHALCIGHFHLERKDEKPIDGIFSLVLVSTKDGWKIMHDHSSISPEKLKPNAAPESRQ